MSFTNYLETDVLKYAFTTDTTARSTTWFTALYTVAPTGAGNDGTEVTTVGTGYARQSTAFSVTGNTASNSSPEEFDVATASYGTVVAVAIFDAVTGGNMLAFADLDVDKTIGIGDAFRIPAGDLDITLD